MRRIICIIAILLALLWLALPAFADHSERIKELEREKQDFIARLQQYQQIAKNIEVRLIQINAIQAELTRLDKEARDIAVAEAIVKATAEVTAEAPIEAPEPVSEEK